MTIIKYSCGNTLSERAMEAFNGKSFYIFPILCVGKWKTGHVAIHLGWLIFLLCIVIKEDEA